MNVYAHWPRLQHGGITLDARVATHARPPRALDCTRPGVRWKTTGEIGSKR
jgi:hypothetical protein